MRNHGRNQAGSYCQRKSKKIMSVAAVLKTFTQIGEQAGPHCTKAQLWDYYMEVTEGQSLVQ